MVNLVIYKEGFVIELEDTKTLTVGQILTESIFKLYLQHLEEFCIYLYNTNFIDSCGAKKVKLFTARKTYAEYWKLVDFPFYFDKDVSTFDLLSFYARVSADYQAVVKESLQHNINLLDFKL